MTTNASMRHSALATSSAPVGRPDISERFFPEKRAGGFSRLNTTVHFYTRVNALLHPDMTVLDFGAGRGEGVVDEARPFVRSLRNLRGRVHKVVGVDVDPVVRTNPTLDEAHVVTPDGTGTIAIPMPDTSVDLIVADWVLEHIADPASAAAEFHRVLRPGGWLCARTPNRWGYVGLAGRLVPNRLHTTLLKRLQPDRQEHDVFPTFHRMNSMGAIRRCFSSDQWHNCTFTNDSDPAYTANNVLLWKCFRLLSGITPGGYMPILLVYLTKI